MGRPLEVVHIAGRLDEGGIQRRLVELTSHLDPELVRSHFVVLEGEPGVLEADVVANGGIIHRCPGGARFPLALFGLLRRLRPDAVHSHSHYASGLFLAVAHRVGVPVRVAHFRNSHDGREPSLRRNAQTWLMRRWIDAHATDILAVSAGAMAGAWTDHRAPDSRCQVVYNGIDLAALAIAATPRGDVRHELAIADEALVVINVGRFSPAKNHLRLLDVFRLVRDRRPGAVLVLVGSGPPEAVAALEERAAALGLTDAVRFTGRRADVVDLLHAADVMAFPSLWEGLPGVVLEACGASLPVVASDLPGVLEIAERLPGRVEVVPLDEDDARWADDVVRAAATRSEPIDDGAAAAFSMERNVERLIDIWSGRHDLPRDC